MAYSKAKYTVQQAKNTKLINKATAVLETANLATLTSYLERLTTSNELRSLNADIKEHVPQQDLVEEFTTLTEYDDKVTRVISLLNNLG